MYINWLHRRAEFLQRNWRNVLAILMLLAPLAVALLALIGGAKSCCSYVASLFMTYSHRTELLFLFGVLEISLLLLISGCYWLKRIGIYGLDFVSIAITFNLISIIGEWLRGGMRSGEPILLSLLYLVALSLLSINFRTDDYKRILLLVLFGGANSSYYFQVSLG